MTEGPSSRLADPPGAGSRPVSHAQRAALTRLAAGAIAILLAVIVFAGSRLVASSQLHSYDPGASPAQSYRLTAGKQYQLSSPVGVAALQKAGLLTNPACSWSPDGNTLNPLTVSAMTDDRDLRTFASFTAPSGGRLQVSCAGIAKVFIDDADDRGTDYSATLVLLTILVGLVGVVLAVSGWYGLGELGGPSYRDARLFDGSALDWDDPADG